MGNYIKEGNGGYIRDDGVKFMIDEFIRIGDSDLIYKFVAVFIHDDKYMASIQPYIKQKCKNGVEFLKGIHCFSVDFDRMRNAPMPDWIQCDCDDWYDGHYLFRPFVKGFIPDIYESPKSDMRVYRSDYEWIRDRTRSS